MWKASMVMLCDLLRLAKIGLSLFIAASCLFGHVLATGTVSQNGVLLALGVLLLAAGGASLNNLQERDLDSRMRRTKSRPLVQERISTLTALVQAVVLLGVGATLIFFQVPAQIAFVAALIAVVLYNGVYTPLKRISGWAIVPGAICGALPPFIGWTGGGGAVWSFQAALLVSLLVLWQVPHFWLILLMHRGDYSGGPVPNLLDIFDDRTIARFFITWIGALAVVSMLYLGLPGIGGGLLGPAVFVNAAGLFVIFSFQLLMSGRPNYRLLFVMLNIMLLVHMGLVSIGRLLG